MAERKLEQVLAEIQVGVWLAAERRHRRSGSDLS